MSSGRQNGGRVDHRQSDLAVMDAQEYKQKRRLRRILDAHDRVEEVLDESYSEYVQGVISAQGKNIRILQAVQEYIREAHTLLLEHLRELGDDEYSEYWHGRDGEPLGEVQMQNDDNIVFWGLRDVLFTDALHTEEWEEYETHRHGADGFTVKTDTHAVPEQVSINAFLRLNEFLSEERDLVGVEFDDDSIPEWGFRELDDEEIEEVQQNGDA